DGRSFTTRRVVAAQGGRPVFHFSASFQTPESGLHHQDAASEVRGPMGLRTEQELAQSIASRLPVGLAAHATAERPIEVRPVDPLDPLDPVVRPPRRQTWYRAAAPLPDAPQMHRCLLAWASDSHFLTTCMQPHGVSWLTPGFQIASLDHAMWFHRPFRMDDWLLYDVWSPSASGGRGLVRGQFHDREGRLVATVMQEGLIRDRRG
ncbi:MAG: acyl-CoA thioesterase II, partial [Myxococcota bacterium]|nr:acyl-CoA thioesterase II [Myxococcota bacterium]